MNDDKSEITTPELIQTIEAVRDVLTTTKYACAHIDRYGGTCMSECAKRNIDFAQFEVHVSLCTSCKSYWLAHRLLEELNKLSLVDSLAAS